MLQKESVIIFYQYFYQKKYSSLNYRFEPSEKVLKMIDGFLERLDKVYNIKLLGENFLWSYFIFQFDYWDELDIQSFSKRIVPSYIIGEKALQRYLERDIEYDWQIESSRIIDKYNLAKLDLINNYVLSPTGGYSESSIKLAEYNTEKGFNNCLTFSSLYNHRDIICISCKFKKECKELLKVNFPKTYASRGYNKENN